MPASVNRCAFSRQLCAAERSTEDNENELGFFVSFPKPTLGTSGERCAERCRPRRFRRWHVTFGRRRAFGFAAAAERCKLRRVIRRLLAEFIGTFALVFTGTGAIVIDQVSGGAITHPGIALTFGLIVLAMIHTFGDVSGAHLNPAVTGAFAAAGRFPWREVAPYAAAQLLGALLASGTLRLLFPENATLGATTPAHGSTQSFVLEVILTFLLVLVILSVSTGAKEKGITAGIAIAAVIALEAMFAGPICGASMNPARSLAPALVSGHLQALWIYLLAPSLGALLAVPVVCVLRPSDCCPATSEADLS